jgi:hypothetical protein
MWPLAVAKRATNWEASRRLYASTGVFIPTRVFPRIPETNAADGRFGAAILGGIPIAAQPAVGYHENAHGFWRDFDSTGEPTVHMEYRADATSGYWTVWAGYEDSVREAYQNLLRSFGANQGDHGTLQGRLAAFDAGIRAAKAERNSGARAPSGTALDRALKALGVAPSVSYARALERNRAATAAMIGAGLALRGF